MAGKKDRKDQMEEKDHKKEELPDLNRNNIGNQPDNQKENKIEHHPQAGKGGGLSSEEYRRKAEEHMNAVKDIWKIFGKAGVFVLAAAIVIAIFSMAWFVSNSKVQVDGTAVSSAGNDFELATPGSNTGKWDSSLLSGIVSGDEVESIDGSNAAMVTSNSKNSILWAITDSSNMGNVNKEGNIGNGITPGSSGELTFYIVSKREGSLSVSLKLELIGKNVLSNEARTLQDVSKDAQDLLEGHILLFAGYGSDKTKKFYNGWISKDADPWVMQLDYKNTKGETVQASLSRGSDGNLIWNAEGVEKDQAYPVTIHWIWPEVFGEYLFKDSTYLSQRPVLFPDDYSDENPNNPGALPKDLFDKMRYTTSVISNRYFKWGMNNASQTEIENSKSEFIKLFPTDSGKENQIFIDLRGGKMNMTTYGKLCSYYNIADQYLGENVRYVELKLDAQ